MNDAPTDRVLAAFFAAFTAVEEGKVAEAEVEHRLITNDGAEEVLTLTVRHEVRHLTITPEENP